MHQNSAGVTSFSFDPDPEAGRRGDRSHHSDFDFSRLENRALLDVQFHKSGVVIVGEAHRGERTSKPCLRAGLLERCAIPILQLLCSGNLEQPT